MYRCSMKDFFSLQLPYSNYNCKILKEYWEFFSQVFSKSNFGLDFASREDKTVKVYWLEQFRHGIFSKILEHLHYLDIKLTYLSIFVEQPKLCRDC